MADGGVDMPGGNPKGCAMSTLPRSASPTGLALAAIAALALVTRRRRMQRS